MIIGETMTPIRWYCRECFSDEWIALQVETTCWPDEHPAGGVRHLGSMRERALCTGCGLTTEWTALGLTVPRRERSMVE